MMWPRQVSGFVAKIAVSLTMLGASFPSSALPPNMTQGNVYTAAGTGIAGYAGDGGLAQNAQISGAQGVAVDRNGNLYIADSANHRVRKVTLGGTITTVAGTGNFGNTGDGGPATNARLSLPSDVAVDTSGNLYIVDRGNSRVRKVTVDGKIETVAGNGISAYSNDGGPATMTALTPSAVAVDAAGNLYIADTFNKRILKVTDGIISTIAGNGTTVVPNPGSATTPEMIGDGGPATSAVIGEVTSMAFDSAGNLYISDYTYHRVRKIAGGIITTVAGTGHWQSQSTRGSATSVAFAYPYGLAIDSADNLYVVAGGSNDSRERFVRKITNGVITLVTRDSLWQGFYEGMLATAMGVGEPRGLAIDGAGNLYIAQYQRNPRENDWSRVYVVATTAGTSVVGLSVACPATVTAGTTVNCSSTATYGNGLTTPVIATWSSSDSAATMTANTLTANSVAADTPVTISASYTENGVAKTASQIVLIKSPSEPALPEHIDCFFDWAEANLSTLFNPPGGISETSNQYRYRYYSGSNMYLTVATDTLRVLYAGELSGGALLDIGPFEAWKAKACSAGSTGGGQSGSGSGKVPVAITNVAIPTVTGTAQPGATVTLTTTNTTTGEVRTLSTVAGSDGNWNVSLTGLTDGSYELLPEAGGVQGSKVTVLVDNTAPVSTLSVTSSNGPNAAGWYTGTVNLAIAATDAAGGQGVARSEYTLDGGAQTVFPTAGLTLNTDGNHTFCYRSVDNAGNAEATRCVMVPIDATVPVVNPVFTSANNTLALNAQDPVSGIASIEISRDGGQTWIAQSGPVGFTRDGAYAIHYRVRDSAGNLATGQATATVATIPNITAPADQAASEAALQNFDLGSFADQAADNPWSIDIDWGDGSVHNSFMLTAPGALGALPHTYVDNGAYTVTIKVTDQAGNTGTRGFTITVANVAPTAVFTATSGPLNEGDIVTLAFSSPADPSPVDTQAGFRYAFDCGDGNGYGAAGTASTATCAALDNPNQTVKGRVIDKDGGATEYSAVVAINNVAPALGVVAGPSSPIVRDTPATITADFADPGVRDTHTVTVDWDDGTVSAGTVTEANGSGSISASHSYAQPGRYTVTLTVTDKDGASAIATYNIQVRGGPPAR